MLVRKQVTTLWPKDLVPFATSALQERAQGSPWVRPTEARLRTLTSALGVAVRHGRRRWPLKSARTLLKRINPPKKAVEGMSSPHYDYKKQCVDSA
jgi:hypothetical protein